MEERHPPQFHCLGSGSCRSVWTVSERELSYKREDGSMSRSPQNDYDMHEREVEYEPIDGFQESKKITY